MDSKLVLLSETRIDELAKNSVSNLTWDYLDDRYRNGNSKITVMSSVYHTGSDFYEVSFKATATHKSRKKYTLILRFYKVGEYITDDPSKCRYSKLESILRNVVHKCDVKMYSNDPSFLYQGTFEGLAKNDLSIFKFPGPKGDHVWDNRHSGSGGLINREIHLTKHLAQVASNIDTYIPKMAQLIKVTE